ncbi:hypothetical protein ASD8599_01392 [Ascidiaceihabitans donghaensis]|uniref:Uncharacterized protein n=1 Tax=Ascidiaceihabitans donghaensis TaxID=1510460 RepID=A0A2R8BC59_9RHOB|nr:O-methyltransferase [Ascidiaceihabitans donghaensis]SPH20653.1 hypothetical protein ASD8599_01392 [Ascidiaceihabitans donghaensis]
MPSFNAINYSTRPSKTIQRQVIFSCLERLSPILGLNNAAYIGFGSIWFTDFVLAHNRLGIERMESIESDDVGFSRANFNKPYSMVSVHSGHSNEVLPNLLDDVELIARPWVIWLDYDGGLTESVIEDVRTLIEQAPENSVLLYTVSAAGNKYGNPRERREDLQNLFGPVVPDDLAIGACKNERLQATLAEYGLEFMRSVAAEANRLGGFMPAFSVAYKDGSPMVTVGGVLATEGNSHAVREVTEAADWQGIVDELITAPHLTVRESAGIQALLPCGNDISRQQIQALGFDLSEEEIAIFQRYYKQYPSFAQVVF